MTEMKRTTISLPDDLYHAIFELRKDERYMRCSYSEIVRRLVEIGLDVSHDGEPKAGDHRPDPAPAQ